MRLRLPLPPVWPRWRLLPKQLSPARCPARGFPQRGRRGRLAGRQRPRRQRAPGHGAVGLAVGGSNPICCRCRICGQQRHVLCLPPARRRPPVCAGEARPGSPTTATACSREGLSGTCASGGQGACRQTPGSSRRLRSRQRLSGGGHSSSSGCRVGRLPQPHLPLGQIALASLRPWRPRQRRRHCRGRSHAGGGEGR